MNSDKKRILVVDDEETLCEVLSFNLENEGYEVTTALSAEEALALDLTSFDLILLDIMLGAISGTQIAEIMKRRKDTAEIPIIFCTAKDSEDDMVKGLNLGADDYITKPYSIKNVLARVRTVLRRSGRTAAQDVMKCGSLCVSLHSKICTIDGKEVKMPKKEFEILALLMANTGRVYGRQEILNAIWPDKVIVVDRVVDVNVTRLRAKLGEYGKHIITKPGYGYAFVL